MFLSPDLLSYGPPGHPVWLGKKGGTRGNLRFVSSFFRMKRSVIPEENRTSSRKLYLHRLYPMVWPGPEHLGRYVRDVSLEVIRSLSHSRPRDSSTTCPS